MPIYLIFIFNSIFNILILNTLFSILKRLEIEEGKNINSIFSVIGRITTVVVSLAIAYATILM